MKGGGSGWPEKMGHEHPTRPDRPVSPVWGGCEHLPGRKKYYLLFCLEKNEI